jgi:recF protein
MQVTSLKVNNFRSYSRFEMNFEPGVHFFYGQNGAGKTNILEALYLAAFGRSFRTRDERDLIRWGESSSQVEVEFIRNKVNHRLGVELSGRSKRYSLNRLEISRRELIGELNIVLFTPDDLQLMKGVPSQRRSFIDSELSQGSRSYFRTLLQYHRTLRQRNGLLRLEREKRGNGADLDPWDAQLSHLAFQLIEKRRDSIQKMSEQATFFYHKIAGEDEIFSIDYLPLGKENQEEITEESLKNQLLENRRQDLERLFTGTGPHRDDIRFLLNGKEMRRFSSQGQQRTGIVALKLAEIEYLYQEKGQYPILLLDDLLSELDASRRQSLLRHVEGRIQTFVTGTEEINHFSARYYQVNQEKNENE